MGKRALAVDAYHVIEIFRKLGLSFEEIAALGFHLEDEPDRKLTPALIAVWYEEEKRERAPLATIIDKDKEPKA
jgi:hypothetical protein